MKPQIGQRWVYAEKSIAEIVDFDFDGWAKFKWIQHKFARPDSWPYFHVSWLIKKDSEVSDTVWQYLEGQDAP